MSGSDWLMARMRINPMVQLRIWRKDYIFQYHHLENIMSNNREVRRWTVVFVGMKNPTLSEPRWSDWTRMDHQRFIGSGWVRFNPNESLNSQNKCPRGTSCNFQEIASLCYWLQIQWLHLLMKNAIHLSKYVQCSSEMITIAGSSSLEREYQCMWHNLALSHWRNTGWAGWIKSA